MLVVDDNEINVRLVRHVLEARGFEVEAAMSGVEALAAIERRRPDLVILDIMMPGLSGLEVLDRLRSNPRQASIPVIMLTARSSDQDVLAGYQSGADYFIAKPLVPRQLLYGVGLVLGREFADARRPDGGPPPPRRETGPRSS